MDVATEFTHAAEAFADAVGSVPAAAWDRTALGEWTVRDLVGHTSRALSTVVTYVGEPADAVAVPDAVTYFTVVSRAVDPAVVAERGRQAGAALGADPRAAVNDLARRATEVVGATAPDALLTTAAGGMRLVDYLPTRVLELTVHTLDLLVALGRPPEFPAAPLRRTVLLTAELAVQGGQAATLALAVTGRSPLPEGFTVL